MIRVLIADDDAEVRNGLKAIAELDGDITVVGQAADGVEAIARTRQLVPDVVLMDVRMPRLDGIEATRRILSTPPAPRVIVLTTFDRNQYVYEAMKAGASGFLLKDVRRGQLVRAIRDVVTGDTLLAPAITRRLVAEYCNAPTSDLGTSTRLNALTDRELEVLTLIGKGFSNGEIAQRLFVGENTVKTHVARIFGKLELRDRAQAVIVAYESGLVRRGVVD